MSVHDPSQARLTTRSGFGGRLCFWGNDALGARFNQIDIRHRVFRVRVKIVVRWVALSQMLVPEPPRADSGKLGEDCSKVEQQFYSM